MSVLSMQFSCFGPYSEVIVSYLPGTDGFWCCVLGLVFFSFYPDKYSVFCMFLSPDHVVANMFSNLLFVTSCFNCAAYGVFANYFLSVILFLLITVSSP